MVQPFLCLPVLPWQGLIENTAHRPSFHPARYLRSPEKGSCRSDNEPHGGAGGDARSERSMPMRRAASDRLSHRAAPHVSAALAAVLALDWQGSKAISRMPIVAAVGEAWRPFGRPQAAILRRLEACYLVHWPPSFTFWACRCPPRGHLRLAAGPSTPAAFIQLLAVPSGDCTGLCIRTRGEIEPCRMDKIRGSRVPPSPRKRRPSSNSSARSMQPRALSCERKLPRSAIPRSRFECRSSLMPKQRPPPSWRVLKKFWEPIDPDVPCKTPRTLLLVEIACDCPQ